jgi:gamma-glutamyltranspeptidase / glutathione hydrolase
LALALERYGTMPLPRVLEPAIALAEEGVPVTWHTTLTIARDLANLRRFPATAAVFLDPAGNPPASIEQTNLPRLRQPDLAQSLRLIAEEGPAAFYEGPFAAAAIAHLAGHGGVHTEADFAAYEATVVPALTVPYRDALVHTVGNGSGGTSLAQALRLLAPLDLAAHGHNSPETLHLLAQVFRVAFADRFAYLADPEHVDVPLDALLSADYAGERARQIGLRALDARPRAGDRTRLGVEHDLPASVPEYVADGSTTHLGAIDAAGNVVSLTQTLLSGWGSRVVVPGTGVLFNNGMMWFDPEPGRPNSVAGGKRPLSNMAPAIVTGDRWAASIGASGGRRIQNCIAQIIVNLLDFGLGMQDAISAPRIDASVPALAVSARLPAATRDRLAALGHHLSVRDEALFTGDFASPVGILRAADGTLTGGADPFYFPATVIGLDG